MRPPRAMVGRASPVRRPELEVLETRAFAQARMRVTELQDTVEAQAAEIAALRAKLVERDETAPAATASSKKRRKRN